jgi:hypothetical protein
VYEPTPCVCSGTGSTCCVGSGGTVPSRNSGAVCAAPFCSCNDGCCGGRPDVGAATDRTANSCVTVPVPSRGSASFGPGVGGGVVYTERFNATSNATAAFNNIHYRYFTTGGAMGSADVQEHPATTIVARDDGPAYSVTTSHSTRFVGVPGSLDSPAAGLPAPGVLANESVRAGRTTTGRSPHRTKVRRLFARLGFGKVV